MSEQVTMSRAAWNALHALAWEYLTQGGDLPGVTIEAVEEAMDALEQAASITKEEEANV
jgi:hypothetical protein